MASYAMFFHGNQSAVFEVHTIAFQHGSENSDCGLRPAAFAPESDDGGCLQTANGDECVKVGIEGDHDVSLVPGERQNLFVFRFLHAKFRDMPHS